MLTTPVAPLQRRSVLLLIFIAVFFSLKGYAQSSAQPVALHRTRIHNLHSQQNGQYYRLFVSIPASYSAKDTARYRVLYVLDGNPFFPLVQSMHDFFVVGEEVPEMIVVGIGYPVDEIMKTMGSRSLDYTPTQDLSYDTMLTKELKVPITSGGAAAFLKTLKKEIMPLIEKAYKTTADKAIAGHSLGALFGAYVLFHEPQLFNRYLLSSISMPWDREEILQEEQAFYEAGHRAIPAKVFISVGDQEGEYMINPMKRLVQAMRDHQYSGLEVEERIFVNETHTSVVTTAFNQGLRSLYKGMVKKRW